MSEDQNTSEKQAKNKESLLKQVRGEFDKKNYQEVKNFIQGKLQEIANHEKAIKMLHAEIDKRWDDYEKGF